MYRRMRSQVFRSGGFKNESTPLGTDLQTNMTNINDRYSSSINTDFVCRTFTTGSHQKVAVFFYASAVNHRKVQESIIEPLMKNHNHDIPSKVTIDTIKTLTTLEEVEEQVNRGNAVLLVDGKKEGYALAVVDFRHRAIEKPENETMVKGPKEAFTESAYVNLSLLRKRIHDTDFVAETYAVGERNTSDVYILYIQDIVNQDMLEKLKERLESIEVDSVRNVALLEQYIEDRPYSLVPTILYSERPDRAAAYLENGYIVLMMENSPACLILPVTFWSFFHSPEDHYMRFLFGNFARVLRLVAFFITLFISSIYVAITNYHFQMIPPDLLFAIAASREKVPFPVVAEVIIMEFAFELIREAGLRIPSPLGPTIGIVGALILGQAAVEANIISPIIIIVAALSGLSSFVISDISFNYTMRLSRFIFILSAVFFGFFGLAGCFFIWVMYLTSVRSFGVPYLSPMTPYSLSSKDTIIRRALKSEFWRPQFLWPTDLKKKR